MLGAIGQGIQGYFQGRDWREGVEDRKRQRERQERMDEITFAEAERAAEAHGWRAEDQAFQRSERDRAAADRDFFSSLYGSSYDAAVAAQEADLAATPRGTAPSATPIQIQPFREFGTQRPEAHVPTPAERSMMGAIPLQAGADIPAARGGSGEDRLAKQVAVEVKGAPGGTRIAGPNGREYLVTPDDRAFDMAGGEEVVEPSMRRVLVGMARAQSAPQAAQRPTNASPVDPMAARHQGAQMRQQAQAALDAPRPWAERVVGNAVIGAANAVNNVVVDPVAKALGAPQLASIPYMRAPIRPNPAAAAPLGAVAARTAAAPAAAAQTAQPLPGPRLATPPVKPNANRDERAVAAAANEAVTQAQTPAMAAARTAAAQDGVALGVPGGGKFAGMKEENVEVAARDLMDYYREHGAPIVVQGLLQRGMVEEAMKFQEFMDAGATKSAMNDWARGMVAAQVGDLDTAADHFASAYNRMDYFGDGVSVVRDETGAIKDEQGNIVGARITFRDDATGDTFERTFDDPADMVNFAVIGLSPEEAFKHYVQQMEAQRGAAQDGIAAAQEAAAARQKAIYDAAVEMVTESQANALTSSQPPMTMDQAIALAAAGYDAAASATGRPATPPADVPVLRRPTE